MAIQALEAGKHVLVEKPMARSAAEARAMVEARDRAGLTLMVGLNQRFTPRIYAVKRLIDRGALGDIYYARTRWIRRRPGAGLFDRGAWFLSPQASGGGPMIDLGVHRLDLTLHLMGYPKAASVSAVAYHKLGAASGNASGKPYDIEDAAMALIRFQDGAAVYVETSYYLNAKDEGQDTYLYGTKGGAILSDAIDLFQVPGEDPLDLEVPPVPGAPSSCVEHFANVLLGREALVSTPEESVELGRILEAIYTSAETGEAIAL
jgi:predicted dehydrogenase